MSLTIAIAGAAVLWTVLVPGLIVSARLGRVKRLDAVRLEAPRASMRSRRRAGVGISADFRQ
jgi:hypothetical protein